MKLRCLASVLLAVAALAACSSDKSTPSKGGSASNDAGFTVSPPPPLDFSAYDAAVNAFISANGLQGASGVVVHKDWGVVHTAGYGAFPADRLYLVASSSKIVSVGIIMRLADQGLVDIDGPIGKYLTAWGTGKPELEVAQLVSNSSGLVGLVDDPLYIPYICQYIDSGTLADCAKTIYTADDAADRKTPDTSFHYGGGQWQLAGGIAEVVSGKVWSDLVKETYIDPCNAESVGYTNQYAKAFAAGGDGGSVGSALSYPQFFQADPANLPQTQNPSIEGGLYVKAEDYGRILLMHLRGGVCENGTRVLSQKAVSRMQEDRIKEKYDGSTGDSTFPGYGLGWWIDRADPGVFADPGAYGAMPWLDLPRGYAAFLVIEADQNVGAKLYAAVKPTLDAVFDAAEK